MDQYQASLWEVKCDFLVDIPQKQINYWAFLPAPTEYFFHSNSCMEARRRPVYTCVFVCCKTYQEVPTPSYLYYVL